MAKVEGEDPDFDELDLPGEDLTEAETFSEPGPPDDQEAPSAVDEPLEAELTEDGKEEEAESQEDETEEEAEKKGGFLKALANADPYTVMLGVVLLAILTAVTCLFMELSTYNFDVGASDYRQQAE